MSDQITIYILTAICVLLGLAGYMLHLFTKGLVRKMRKVSTEHFKLSIVCLSIAEQKNLSGGALTMEGIDLTNLDDVRDLLMWSTQASFKALVEEDIVSEKN